MDNKIFISGGNTYFLEQLKELCGKWDVEVCSLSDRETLALPKTGEEGLVNENLIKFPPTSISEKVMSMSEAEGQAIQKAINECSGNLTEAAKILEIGRATLYRKVKQYSIDVRGARRRKVA